MFFVCFISLLWAISDAYSIEVQPGKQECFIVKTERDITISGNYEVLDGSADAIFVKVTGPNGSVHYQASYSGPGAVDQSNSEGNFDFDADEDGDYTMCITNGGEDGSKSDGVVRTVGFNFREMDLTDEEDLGGEEYTGLENELYDLQRGLDFLTDHQSYMSQREDIHKEELDLISGRVMIWTIIEAIVLISLAVWQISYIRSFFETKRRL